MRRAAVEGCVRLPGRRVRVAACDGDAAVSQDVDEVERPVQFRRERDVRDRTGCKQTIEQPAIGIPSRRLRVHAQAGG